MLQLSPPLPLVVEGKGEGWAHLVTWNSLEHSLYWTVFLDTGEIWTVPNEKVRACKNWTAERYGASRPASVDPTPAAG